MTYELSRFESNLQKSIIKLDNRKCIDFWLNKDGTVTVKSSWIGRVVRWIQNFLFDKTLNDIWHVFEKTLKNYDFSNDFALNLPEEEKEYTEQFVADRRSRAQFAAKFLLSRKAKLDTWLKKYPKKKAVVKVFLDKYAQELQTNSNADREKRILSVKVVAGENGEQLLEPREGTKDPLRKFVQSLQALYVPDFKKDSLSKKPPEAPLEISPEVNPDLYAKTDIYQLVSFLQQTQFESIDYDEKIKMIESLKTMCLKVKQRDPNVFGINHEIHQNYYDQIELFLKNIVWMLTYQKGLSEDKKKQALLELAEASALCPPRWMEESKRQYRYLSLQQMEFGEAKILEYIQNFKEDLFLELFQNLTAETEFHILDSFRKEYGKELGLDCSTVDLDAFTYTIPKFFLVYMKRAFLKDCKARRLVKAIKHRMTAEYDPKVFDYMKLKVRESGIEKKDPTGYIYEHFYDNDGTELNDDGVIFILQQVGILKK